MSLSNTDGISNMTLLFSIQCVEKKNKSTKSTQTILWEKYLVVFTNKNNSKCIYIYISAYILYFICFDLQLGVFILKRGNYKYM